MSHCDTVQQYVEANPGKTRVQIAAAVNLKPVQVGNALAILRVRGKVQCNFVGRFSTWTPPTQTGRATPAVNSVWALGQ